jgi:AraC-like DNA-binding protein
MQGLGKGTYLGTNKDEKVVKNLLLSHTQYYEGLTSDWHYHENPYFAFVLQGGSVEKKRSGESECKPGDIIFYNWQEPHRNIKYQARSLNFNIEFEPAWTIQSELNLSQLQGNLIVSNVDAKLILLQLYKEYKLSDESSSLSIQSLALELISKLISKTCEPKFPDWVKSIRELLNDQWDYNFSLAELSSILKVHPVTISRYFPKYFHCSLGTYIRKIRICKSVQLIRATDQNLVQIAFECGFADQSHFIRAFKAFTGFLPRQFRNC